MTRQGLCTRRAVWLLAVAYSGLRPVSGSDGGPCDCLSWKEVYEAGRAVCGEGLEFYEIVKPRTNLTLLESSFFGDVIGAFAYHEFCTSFFQRLDSNHCVNIGMFPYDTKEWYGEQWCYVSAECDELNGGQRVADKQRYPGVLHLLSHLPSSVYSPLAKTILAWYSPSAVPRDVSWKLCTRGRDARLRDMVPLELLSLAKRLDSVVGFVTKIAYPRLPPPDWTWNAVREAVIAGDIGSMPPPLVRAIAAKDAVVIDVDPEGKGDQRIVRGTEIYELEQACTSSGCGGDYWPFRRGRDVGEL